MAKFKADLLFFFLVSMIICLIITRKCVDTLLSGFSEKQVSMSCKQAFLLSSTLLWSYTLPWPELTETTIKHKNNLLPEWFLSLIENKECFLCCQQPVEQWGLNQHKNKQYSTSQKDVLQTLLISIFKRNIYVHIQGLKESPTRTQLWQVNVPSRQALFHAQ